MSIYRIYCDESRQNKGPYKLMGGVWVDQFYAQRFVDDFHMRILNNFSGMPAHMKWTRVPGNTNIPLFKQYIELLDLFFEYNDRNLMFFKTIIADNTYNMEDPYYHNNDYENGFYKLYYDLILHTLDFKNRYHIRIAQRDVSKKIMSVDESYRLMS